MDWLPKRYRKLPHDGREKKQATTSVKYIGFLGGDRAKMRPTNLNMHFQCAVNEQQNVNAHKYYSINHLVFFALIYSCYNLYTRIRFDKLTKNREKKN